MFAHLAHLEKVEIGKGVYTSLECTKFACP